MRGIGEPGPQAKALGRVLEERGFEVVRGAHAGPDEAFALVALPGGFEVRRLVEDRFEDGEVHPDVGEALALWSSKGVPIAAPCMALAVVGSALPDMFDDEMTIDGAVTLWPHSRVVTTSRSLFGVDEGDLDEPIGGVVDRALSLING